MGTFTKVVIDTNVFISGFGWDGKPESVLRLLEQGIIINHITVDIFDEMKRVAAYPKLKFSEPLQVKMLEFAFAYSRFVNPAGYFSASCPDPDDNKFIECAVEADAEFIISGDPHLLDMKAFNGIRIVSPAVFLELFVK